MPVTPLAGALTVLSVGAWGVAADQVSGGANLGGIAAIIAASAAMVSAFGAIIIGWRTNKNNGENDLEKELLMKLLKEQLEKDDKP